MHQSAISVLSILALAFATPLPALAAQPSGVAALALLERGEWELHERGGAPVPRRICIGDGGQLLQLRHPGLQCRRFVIRDAPTQASVAYDCAQDGRGRTDVRVETSRLVQIESQGISDGAPFAMIVEGRRIGACKSAALIR